MHQLLIILRRRLDRAFKNGYRRLLNDLLKQLMELGGLSIEELRGWHHEDDEGAIFDTCVMIDQTLQKFDRLPTLEISRRLGYIHCYFNTHYGQPLTDVCKNTGLTPIKF